MKYKHDQFFLLSVKLQVVFFIHIAVKFI